MFLHLNFVWLWCIPPLMVASSQSQEDHRGQEFILAFINGHVNEKHYALYFWSEEAAAVTTTSDHTTFFKTETLTPLSPKSVYIPGSAFEYRGGMTMAIERKVVYVTSTKPISLFGSSYRQESGGTFLAIPVQRLTGHYVLVSRSAIPAPSEFIIAGTQDNTEVTITLRLVTGSCGSDGHTDGTTITKTIKRFDVIGLTCGGDFTGTVITSDKPVAVFSGNQMAALPATSPKADLLMEMMIPVETFGSSYIITTTYQSPTGTIHRVVAHLDNTTVTVGGQDPFVLTAGSFQDIDSATSGTQLLYSSKPVLVVMYGTLVVGGLGDVFMAIVPPTNRFFSNPWYDYTWLLVTSLNIYVTVYYNATAYPGVTFSAPDQIDHIPGSDLAVLSAPALDVKGSSFETQVQHLGMVIYGQKSHDAAYGFLGGMSFAADPCVSVPCLNDGRCVADGGSFHCLCGARYTGSTCETAVVITATRDKTWNIYVTHRNQFSGCSVVMTTHAATPIDCGVQCNSREDCTDFNMAEQPDILKNCQLLSCSGGYMLSASGSHNFHESVI